MAKETVDTEAENAELSRAAERGEQAQELKKNPYFIELFVRMESQIDERITRLASDETEEFITLAQQKERNRAILKVVDVDEIEGKRAAKKLAGKTTKRSLA